MLPAFDEKVLVGLWMMSQAAKPCRILHFLFSRMIRTDELHFWDVRSVTKTTRW